MYTPSSFLADEPFFQSCSLDCSWKCISKQSNNNRSKDFLFSISHCSSSIQAYEAASVSTINPTKTFFLWIFFFLSIVCISVYVCDDDCDVCGTKQLNISLEKGPNLLLRVYGPKKISKPKRTFFSSLLLYAAGLAWLGFKLSSCS